MITDAQALLARYDADLGQATGRAIRAEAALAEAHATNSALQAELANLREEVADLKEVVAYMEDNPREADLRD